MPRIRDGYTILKSWLSCFARSEDGATAIEYAMIASMLSVAILGSAFLLGGGLEGLWNFISTEVMSGLGR